MVHNLCCVRSRTAPVPVVRQHSMYGHTPPNRQWPRVPATAHQAHAFKPSSSSPFWAPSKDASRTPAPPFTYKAAGGGSQASGKPRPTSTGKHEHHRTAQMQNRNRKQGRPRDDGEDLESNTTTQDRGNRPDDRGREGGNKKRQRTPCLGPHPPPTQSHTHDKQIIYPSRASERTRPAEGPCQTKKHTHTTSAVRPLCRQSKGSAHTSHVSNTI